MNDLAPVAIAGRQQSRAADPDASVWVSASAGTGKTKVLTDRVLALMLKGASPQRILCLTFTKAAAAEMSNRVAGQLSGWVTESDEDLVAKISPLLGHAPGADDLTRARRLFARVLETPGGMKIQTIHAFCQSVLRRFPLEAGLAPHFDLLGEQDTVDLLDTAEEAVISRAHDGREKRLAKALGVIVGCIHELRFPDLMEDLTNARDKLERLLTAHGTVFRAVGALRTELGLSPKESADMVLRKACTNTSFDKKALTNAAAALAGGSKTDAERGAVLSAWLTANKTDRMAMFDDYTNAYLTAAGTVRAKLATKKVTDADADILTTLIEEAERLCAVLDRLRSVETAVATEALLTLGHAFLEEYDDRKAAFARLDYNDLIQRTRALLERPGVATWVLFKLDGGLDHILIDEAQDTSPDQWAVVKALTDEFFSGEGRHEDRTDEVRTVFAVGDRKQSIYSFQGAAPENFDHMQQYFSDRVNGIGQSWTDVSLDVSFRSTPAVLRAVDAVFSAQAAQDGVILSGEDMVHLAARQGQGGLVELWPPMDPDDADEPTPWKPPVERLHGESAESRLARLIAKKIAYLCANETLDSKNRPVAPGDIMVLVRRRTGFVDSLVRALKDLHIPVAGVDRMILIEQMAVMDLVALGRFLLLPQDDLTLATLLKSPLIGLSEEQLFDLAYGRGDRSLWSAVSDHAGADSVFGEAHTLLRDLLDETDFRSPFALYAHVLTALDGRKKLLSRLGMDADDPIDEFLAQALAYERLHVPSLEGFLHWLEHGRLEVKRDLEQASRNAVRVMTVHGAKGLQAPIVFLPDTLQTPAQSESVFWTTAKDGAPLCLWTPRAADRNALASALKDDGDTARDREYRRLLYVAMTRAEDRLYICGWNTRRTAPAHCWYTLIRDALAPLMETVNDPVLADTFGTSGEVLRLTGDQSEPPEGGAMPEDEIPIIDAVPPFAETVAPEEPAPPKPLTPSQPVLENPPVHSPRAEDVTNRFQRGLLIHRLLQSLPDLPVESRRKTAEAFLSQRCWNLSKKHIAAWTDETLAVLSHKAYAPLYGPDSKAEVPVTGLVDGRVISGQVDRLVVTDTDVLIIDYKTNRPPPDKAEDVSQAYVVQMASYRSALQAIYPDHTVRCLLLWTDGPSVIELPQGILDQAWRQTVG